MSNEELIADNARLKQENETLRYRVTVLRDIAGENNLLRCRAEAELKATRKVADAAVGWSMAYTLKLRFILASSEPEADESADAAYRVIVGVVFDAQQAFADAVAEYCALTEPPMFSPEKQAVIERALDKLDEIA